MLFFPVPLHLDICPFPSLPFRLAPFFPSPCWPFSTVSARFQNVSSIIAATTTAAAAMTQRGRIKNVLLRSLTGHLLTVHHGLSVTHNSLLGRDGADCK